jgi:HEAT repeat protein
VIDTLLENLGDKEKYIIRKRAVESLGKIGEATLKVIDASQET